MSILPAPDGDPPAPAARGDQHSPFREDQGRLELNKASSERWGESPAPSAPLAGRGGRETRPGENTDVSVLG